MQKEKITSEEIVHQVASAYVAKYSPLTLEDTFETCLYDSDAGVYIPARAHLMQYCENILQNASSNHIVREIGEKVKRMSFTKRETFDQDARILNVKNGLLNLYTGELLPHSPGYPSLIQLPVNYDKDADCPAIKSFLYEVLTDDERRKVIKMLGDILLPGYPYQSFYFLVGAGNNGKGTLGRLIKAFVGNSLISSVRLHALADDRFATADLYNKLVNFAGDVASSEIKDWALVRSLTGGDTIRVQRKHAQPFEMVNRAKLIFAFNKLPEMDPDYSSFRRLVMITFDRIFEGEDKDRGLDAKLHAPSELCGLLNLALEGISMLREDDGFDESWVETKARYERLQNEFKMFIEDEFIVDEAEKVPVELVRDEYVKWAKKTKRTILDGQAVGQRMAALGFENKQNRSTKVRYYHGLRLRGNSGQEKL